jgi:hypothetical protein
MNRIILGIETSCDDTSIAIMKNGKLLSNVTFTSNNINKKYGGIVPELSARYHCKHIDHVFKQCVKKAKIFLVIVEGVLNISSSILENLYSKYEKLDIQNRLEDYLKINKIFSNMFNLFFQCIIRTYKKYNIKNENIFNIYYNISFIGIKLLVDINAKDNNRIISWTGDKTIDKDMNAMKINIFKFLNYQVSITENTITDKNKVENHNQLIKIILSNLEWLIMNKFTYLIKI